MKGARFNHLIGHLRQVFAELPDRRKGQNLSYLDPAHLEDEFIKNGQNPGFRVETFVAVAHFS